MWWNAAPCPRHALPACVLLWAACLAFSAQAQTASDTCTVDASDATPPYTVWLDQYVQVDDALGADWMLLAPIQWTCTRSADAHTTLAVQPVVSVDGSGIIAGETLTYAGESYRRFTLQQGGDEISYIARWRSTIAGAHSDWRPLTPWVGQADGEATAIPVSVVPGAAYRANVEVQVRLFKHHPTSPSANTSVHFAPLSAALRTQRKQAGAASGEDVQPAQSPGVSVHFKYIHQACVTPNVRISLPPVLLTPDTAELWSAGPTTAFELRLEHCPGTVNGIDYTFRSIPHQAINNGVLPLLPASTAAGVSIQLLDSSHTPLRFDVWHALGDYTPGLTAATYTIPLAARAIRIPGLLRPGRVHAAMNVTVEYK